MSKIQRVFALVLDRYANAEYEPPKALIERPNTTVFPALREAVEAPFDQGAAQAYAQPGQGMMGLEGLMGGMAGTGTGAPDPMQQLQAPMPQEGAGPGAGMPLPPEVEELLS